MLLEEYSSRKGEPNYEKESIRSYFRKCNGSQPDGMWNKENESKDGTKTYTVGISQFAEHGSLDNCREGFIEGLKEAGFEEGKNLTIK